LPKQTNLKAEVPNFFGGQLARVASPLIHTVKPGSTEPHLVRYLRGLALLADAFIYSLPFFVGLLVDLFVSETVALTRLFRGYQ